MSLTATRTTNFRLSANNEATGDEPLMGEALVLGGLDAGDVEVPGPQAMDEDGSLTFTTGNLISIDDGNNGRRTVTLSIEDGVLNVGIANGVHDGVTVSGEGTNLLTLDGQPDAINAALDGLVYTPPADASGSRTLTITAEKHEQDGGDGGGGHDDHETDTGVVQITINEVNDEPTLTATGNNPTFIEGGAAADLFSAVAASAEEAGQTLASMTLTVSNVTDGAAEILSFDGSDVALTNGNSVTTATNGLTVNVAVAGNIATVSFAGATLSAAAVQTLVDGLAYRNTSANPTDANRVVTITQLVDSGSGTAPSDNSAALAIASTVDVEPVNNFVTVNLQVAASLTYTENDPATVIAPAAIVSDPDSPDFDGGALNVSLSGQTTDDQLGIRNQGTGAGQIGVSGANVTYGGTTFGTFTGGANGTDLVVSFNSAATPAAVEALVRNITYFNISNAPLTNTRTVTGTVTDGDGGTAQGSATIDVVPVDDPGVAVNDAFATDEANSVTGNLFASNPLNSDVDLDNGLAVAAVNGVAGNVGGTITLPSGALLLVNANGTFDYNPNDAFDRTPTPDSGASNQPAVDSFTYSLANGGTATVTITIAGLDGDDLLIGSAAIDTLRGGIGNDIYIVNNSGDTVIENPGEGSDLVFTTADYVLSDSLERLGVNGFATTFAINLTGNGLDNELWGNDGANILNGGAGADILRGHGGDDIYIVDNAGDQVIEGPGGGVDLIFTGVDYVLGNDMERLGVNGFTTTFAINLTGNGLDNEIWGNDGNNILNGGAGADILRGLGGNDIYFVDNAGDQVIESAGGGFDLVYTSVDTTLADQIERLAVNGFSTTFAINLIGNALDNELFGNDGFNILVGGGGADILHGRGGSDIYFVDDSGDVVVEHAGGGFDLVYTSVDHVLSDHVERLAVNGYSTTFAVDLTGNGFANELIGNDGENVLDGGAGADLLRGNGGADIFAFTTALGGGNIDQMLDFQVGLDHVALDDAIFSGLAVGALDAGAFRMGTAAQDADDRIIYDSSTGAVYFDADGNGAGAAVQFATLPNNLATLTATDFIVI